VVFTFLIIVTVTVISLHVASYGLYALKQENNRRGGLGAFTVALLTLLAPLFVLWFRANFR